MRDTLGQIELQARMGDFEARLARVEALTTGAPVRERPAQELMRLYVLASKKRREPTEEEVELWQQIIQGLGVTEFLVLAREIRDPFPWRPFLGLLDYFTHLGTDVETTTNHLVTVAERLLKAQGLSKVRVCDVVGAPLRIHEAFSSISK